MRLSWVLVLLLSACTAAPQHVTDAPADKAESEAPHLKESEIHADLIRQMLNNGQYYAALAHIEEQKRGGGSDELTLLEGDARSHLGQVAQADALYRKLLGGSYAAQAYHGLGRLYVAADLNGAIRNLRNAVERAPTEVDFRNDLGYALMEAGSYTEAMTQLSTAAELAPSDLKSRSNLIVLMMLTGNEGAVQRLAQGLGSAMTPEKMKDLRDSAQSIRDKQNARAAKSAG